MHDQVFQLTSPSDVALLSFLAILLGLALLLWVLYRKAMPRITRTLSVVLLASIAVIFAWVAGRSLQADIEVNLTEVKLNVPLYGRDISRSDILPTGVRELNLAQEPEFATELRRNGFGLPNYQLGWFKLKNGRQALVFITDPTRLVILPTKDNYFIIVSSDEPQALVNAF